MNLYEKYKKYYKKLTPAQETKLFEELPDDVARDRILRGNILLVPYIAKHYMKSKNSYDDILQEGFIGLATAIDKFELDREVKFSTYAGYWIRKYIRELLYNNINKYELIQKDPDLITKILHNRACPSSDVERAIVIDQLQGSLERLLIAYIIDEHEIDMFMDRVIHDVPVTDICVKYNMSKSSVYYREKKILKHLSNLKDITKGLM